MSSQWHIRISDKPLRPHTVETLDATFNFTI